MYQRTLFVLSFPSFLYQALCSFQTNRLSIGHQNTLFNSSSPSKPSQEVVQACVPISNLYHKDTTAMETLDEQYEVNVPSDVVSCLDRWYSGYTKDILFWGEDRSYWLDSVAHQAAQNLVRKGEAVIFIQPPPNAAFTDGDDLVRDFLALFAECLQLKEHRIDRDRLSVLESMVARSSSRVVVFFHRLRFMEAGQGEFSQLVQALLQSERFRVFVTSESYLRRPNGESVVNVSDMFPGRTRVSLR